MKNKLEYLFWLLGLASIFLLVLKNNLTYLDVDLGWHLRVAKDLLVGGIFPFYDIYTHTHTGFAWVDHEWLSELVTFFVYSKTNFLGLAIFYSLIVTVAIYLQIKIAQRLKVLNIFTFMASFLVLLTLSEIIAVRMQIFSWLFLSIIFYILFEYYKSDQTKSIYFLPLIFLLWTNFHGSFPLGIVLLLVATILSKDKKLLLVVFLSILATFINPYGISLWQEIIKTITDWQTKSMILEWQSLLSYPINFWVILYLLIFWILFIKEKIYKKNPLFFTISLIILLTLSLLSKRNITLFTLVSLPFFASGINGFILKYLKFKKEYFAINKTTIFTLVIATIITSLSLLQKPDRLVVDPYQNPDITPYEAVEYLKEHKLEGNMFNELTWGGYLLWKLPDEKVFYDGRMAHWQDDELRFFVEYSEIIRANDHWENLLKKYNVRIVLVANQSNIEIYTKPDWLNKLIFQSKTTNKDFSKNKLREKLLNSSSYLEIYNDQKASIFIKKI